MKKIFSCLLICISVSNLYAQNKAKDSLKLLLQNEKTDTGRVLALAQLSFLYSESNPDSTMSMALEALTLAQFTGTDADHSYYYWSTPHTLTP